MFGLEAARLGPAENEAVKRLGGLVRRRMSRVTDILAPSHQTAAIASGRITIVCHREINRLSMALELYCGVAATCKSWTLGCSPPTAKGAKLGRSQ
jgi:hypothetical protein